jgi:hypothetical protein
MHERCLSPRLVARKQLGDHFFIQCDWRRGAGHEGNSQRMDGRTCVWGRPRCRALGAVGSRTIDRRSDCICPERPARTPRSWGCSTLEAEQLAAALDEDCVGVACNGVELAMGVARGSLLHSSGWRRRRQQRGEKASGERRAPHVRRSSWTSRTCRSVHFNVVRVDNCRACGFASSSTKDIQSYEHIARLGTLPTPALDTTYSNDSSTDARGSLGK